jgi:hypothetical protein
MEGRRALMKENQTLLRFSCVHFDILATITIIYNNAFGNRERKRKEEVLSTMNNKVEKYDALDGVGLDLSRHGESSHHGCFIFTYFHAYECASGRHGSSPIRGNIDFYDVRFISQRILVRCNARFSHIKLWRSGHVSI